MRTLILILLAITCRAEGTFGVWKLNLAGSRGAESNLTSLILRIEPHPGGEVFTIDTTRRGGHATTVSTVLYLDGKLRDFEGTECSGKQASRRLGQESVEIVRRCKSGALIRIVVKLVTPQEGLIVETAHQEPGGRRYERRLMLERQREGN